MLLLVALGTPRLVQGAQELCAMALLSSAWHQVCASKQRQVERSTYCFSASRCTGLKALLHFIMLKFFQKTQNTQISHVFTVLCSTQHKDLSARKAPEIYTVPFLFTFFIFAYFLQRKATQPRFSTNLAGNKNPLNSSSL